jgi:hypothetical protein
MRTYRAKRREPSGPPAVILLEELNRCEYKQRERDDFPRGRLGSRARKACYMRGWRLETRRERIAAGE